MQRRDAALRAMRDHPIFQRRVCVLIGVDPKTLRRERPPDNPEIRLEMNKIAEKRRRFGYRSTCWENRCRRRQVDATLARAGRSAARWVRLTVRALIIPITRRQSVSTRDLLR